MTKIDIEAVKTAENTVRDIKNWLAVFAEEYSIPEEANAKLNQKIDELARTIGNISCKGEDVDDEMMQEAAEAERELKNWTSVFASQHELSEEAAKVLNEKFDELAE